MSFDSDGSRMRRDEGVYIPSELWPEILKRVPAKKLLQLKCVCKSWKSLISSSSLVSRHNLNTIATISTSSTECYSDETKGTREESCALHGDTTPLIFPNIPNYQIDRPFSPGDVLHGVILLRYTQVGNHKNALLCVWNPCIRKHVTLPWSMSRSRLEGAWFDAAINDIKVVRTQLEGSYDLLSVRGGVWRKNLPFPHTGLNKAGRLGAVKGVLFNGSIHWITVHQNSQIAGGRYKFLRFDCELEEFNLANIPSQLLEGLKMQPLLMLLDLGAGAVLSLANFVTPKDCELWLMQPGSSSSWARLDRKHPKFAAAATQDVVSCSGLTFKPLLDRPAHFQMTSNAKKKFYHFKQTMMLMDIGNPSSS